MGGPISRRPSGLLDLLLTQQQGDNPDQLGDMVAPVIDLVTFYEADRIRVSAVTTNLSAVGVTATHTVPSGESWRLMCAGFAHVFNTANQEAQLYLSLSGFGSAALGYCHDFGLKQAGAASDVAAGGFWFPRPMVIPSGTAVKFTVGALTLDASTISLLSRVIYIRMES